MRLLFVNQFYYPDISATSQIATELCEDLAAAGHEVSVLAAQGTYEGGTGLPKTEVVNGVHIERSWASSLGKSKLVYRAADYATFYASALAKAAMLGKFDVVVTLSTPPMIALLGAILSLRGTKFIYWLQDIYPDLAIQFGVLKQNSLSARSMQMCNRWLIRRANMTVVLSGAMRDHWMQKGAPASRIEVIPNWADGNTIKPMAHKHNSARSRLAPEGRFMIMYSGNMGVAHDLKTVIDAARLLEQRSDILFVFSGGGAKKPWLEQQAIGRKNVVIHDYVEKAGLGAWLSAGDLHLVTLEANVGGLLEPSKAYGIMAAGRPIAFVGPTNAGVGQMVASNQLGMVIDNGDAVGLAAGIARFADNRKLGEACGAAARRVFDAQFDRRHAAQRFSEILARVHNSELVPQ